MPSRRGFFFLSIVVFPRLLKSPKRMEKDRKVRKLIKHADENALRDRAIVRLLLLGSGIGSMASSEIARYRLNKAMEAMPYMRGRGDVYEKLLNAARLDPELPAKRIYGFGNAAYVEPGEDAASFAPSGKSKKALETGAVIYDPEFLKPGILAHELGHASIRLAPWWSPSRFNQSYLRPVGDVLNAFTPVAAAISAMAPQSKESPWIPLALGAGLGGITAAPTLFNEYQATRRGLRYLKSLGMPEKDYEQNKQTLRRAGHTYLSGGMAAPIIAGLAGSAVAANR